MLEVGKTGYFVTAHITHLESLSDPPLGFQNLSKYLRKKMGNNAPALNAVYLKPFSPPENAIAKYSATGSIIAEEGPL